MRRIRRARRDVEPQVAACDADEVRGAPGRVVDPPAARHLPQLRLALDGRGDRRRLVNQPRALRENPLCRLLLHRSRARCSGLD
ncbi:MAG: hypothetical protein NZM40_10590 [Sphingomonadaceae bacterium]|nr:hypothetical protein [Sphingomonadaceae bacterium]MDW8414929.1 hypothetical protein [Thermaurantiacus sp.]